MKKIIVLAALIMTSVGMYAQRNTGRWSLQPKAGLNIGTMTDSEGSDPRIAFVLGGEAEFRPTRFFSLTGGVHYSQQGIKGYIADASCTVKMDYVNVPMLANFYIAKGLALKAGFQPGFLVNDKAKIKVNGSTVEVDLDQAFLNSEISDVKMETMVLSIPLGISYQYHQLVFDARANLGVTKAVHRPGYSSTHNVFQFTAGYKFSL